MENLHQAFDPKTFREKGHALIDQIANYLEGVMGENETPVLPWKTPEENYAHWKENISKKTPAKDFYQAVIDSSMHLHHPKYVGHQVSPPLPDAILSGLLVGALKNGSGVYEMAPLAAPMEKIVMDFLAQYLGYGAEASGFLTSGGTLANLTALLTARQIKVGDDIWNGGNPEGKQLAIMVSEEAHYCVDRAVKIMGLGAAGIVKIPTNEKFQVDTEQLEAVYNNALAEGKTIFAIVGNACSTSVGAYDDLEKIGAFAQKHQLWFHADGAHGGAAIFSKKYKHLTKGIELADSVIIDGHKMMMTSGLITALIYKDGKNGYQTFHQKAQYLWENTEEEWFNLTKRTFECTKFANVIELFSIIKNYGFQIFDQYITQTYDLAKGFARLLSTHPDFELAHEPEANILCFRIFEENKSTEKLNQLNVNIRKKIIQSGNFYLVQTNINGSTYLRVSLMNPLTTIDLLEELLDEILKVHRTIDLTRPMN